MNDIQKSLDSLHDKVDSLSDKISAMPCAVNDNRIKMLERITYGAVKLILVAFVVSLIYLVIPKSNNKVIASNVPIMKGIK